MKTILSSLTQEVQCIPQQLVGIHGFAHFVCGQKICH